MLILDRKQRPYITQEERMLLWSPRGSVSLFYRMMPKGHFHEILLFGTVKRIKKREKRN